MADNKKYLSKDKKMKKLSIFLAVMFLLSSFALTVSAAESFDIPKAAAAPTIDGVMNADEWKGALKYTMSSKEREFNYNQPEEGTFTESAIYWMWDDKNLYFFATIDDPTASGSVASDASSAYSVDGLHFQMYGGESGNNQYKLPYSTWLIFVPRTNADRAGAYVENGFGYPENVDLTDDQYGCKVAGKMTSDSAYVIEAAIPWGIFEGIIGNGWEANFTGKAGQNVRIESIIWEVEGTARAKRFVAGVFRNGSEADVFTLSDKTAGGAATPTETTAAATTTAATPTETTAANVTTVVDATTPAPDTNPPTDDPAATTVDAFIVTSAVLALAACGGIAVSKKRK